MAIFHSGHFALQVISRASVGHTLDTPKQSSVEETTVLSTTVSGPSKPAKPRGPREAIWNCQLSPLGKGLSPVAARPSNAVAKLNQIAEVVGQVQRLGPRGCQSIALCQFLNGLARTWPLQLA